MNLAIVGSREITDYAIVFEKASKIVEKNKVTHIVSGGAKGVDTLARRFAEEKGIPLLEFKPDYSTYGRGAPLQRNTTIVEHSDVVLAFVTPNSKGTWDTIKKAEKMGRIVKIVNVSFSPSNSACRR